ncbi:carbohydrate-binding protein [Achlya hypogyna]|uniref:Carbohydrate-binding protein n=1 Tax=Achlya hypogyna TaxID=1202772 RepID=A0A1V9ZED2_ACHHY|nr:carbohydrate-binding protein [Achlya hypogyna]
MGKCHWWPLFAAAVVITGGAFIITYFTHTGIFAESSQSSNSTTPSSKPTKNATCSTRGYYANSKNDCVACPVPTKTFAVFWQTYTDGCLDFIKTDAFKYITHVYWGFALINNQTGAVSQSFQGNDATLQTKCVKQYASIGGQTMRTNFLALNTPAKIATFGETAAKLVQKFGFDGIDIDDESGNVLAGGDWKTTASTNVEAYLTSLRSNLDALPRKAQEPAYGVTWDEFFTSLDPTCNTATGDYQRCYDPKITPLVDQVNIMAYNAETAATYDNLLMTTVPTAWTAVIPATKLVMGGCVGTPTDQGACSYGATPTGKQLAAYAADGATKYGGTMLWTGSTDIELSNGANIINMGKAGSYGFALS